ncbi:MAG: DUF1398 domain-containing protein, partial [Cytophagales bacterium]|nr:DUF1398 domain-containing protein [Cytophagales bacterium]
MITINKIKEAHSKVKSGADFPKYIQEIKQLGVVGYVNYVSDGHAVFSGEDGTQALWESKYPPIP